MVPRAFPPFPAVATLGVATTHSHGWPTVVAATASVADGQWRRSEREPAEEERKNRHSTDRRAVRAAAAAAPRRRTVTHPSTAAPPCEAETLARRLHSTTTARQKGGGPSAGDGGGLWSWRRPHGAGRTRGFSWRAGGASHWARRAPPPPAWVGIERGGWSRREAPGEDGDARRGAGARRQRRMWWPKERRRWGVWETKR